MHKLVRVVLIGGLLFSGFATDSRIISMGRFDHFFMDDYSIYKNPANINVFPNMMLGSIGTYGNSTETPQTFPIPENRAPQKPYFGSIVSYSSKQSENEGTQYPMTSFAMTLNRYDEWLDYITPGSTKFVGLHADTSFSPIAVNAYDPVGKVDLMVGGTLKNGLMLGGGGYIAFQKSKVGDDDTNEKALLLTKGTVGINAPLSKTVDMEASVNVVLMTQKLEVDTISTDLINAGDTVTALNTVADNDVGFDVDVRFFSALSTINGEFVPHIGARYLQFNGGTGNIMDFNAGLGLNINIDRGFFWAGIEGFYMNKDHDFDGANIQKIGGKIAFGIERNVLWDWFVVRAGGVKVLEYVRYGDVNDGKTIWEENTESDGSDSDLLSIGLGVNIENRLKIDVVMAEDVYYTFTNLFSGNADHLFTRISATFSF